MSALRQLSVGEQVGLLFLILFGVLLLVTALSFLSSLRERDEAQRTAFERYLRDLRAVWVFAALFWLAWVSGPVRGGSRRERPVRRRIGGAVPLTRAPDPTVPCKARLISEYRLC